MPEAHRPLAGRRIAAGQDGGALALTDQAARAAEPMNLDRDGVDLRRRRHQVIPETILRVKSVAMVAWAASSGLQMDEAAPAARIR